MIPTHRPPTHPGEMLLEEFLKPLGITQVDAADKMGISLNRLNELIRGKRGANQIAPCKEAVMTFRVPLLTTIVTCVALAVIMGSDPALQGQAVRGKAALLDPAELKEQAPATYRVNFETSAGPFVVEVRRDWAPNGADRFYNLVQRGFYDTIRFYRVIPGFVAQFGIHGDPELSKLWLTARIPDDLRKQNNKKGYLAFMAAGVGRRTTQVFINLADNTTLDTFNAPAGIVPFGQVISGMNVVERLYGGYGEAAPTGKGPQMTPLYSGGNAYLEKEFPKMDYVKTATIVP